MSDHRDFRVEDIRKHAATLPEGTNWAVLDDGVDEGEFPGRVVCPADGATPADLDKLEAILNA
jgi:hypothetical protein